MLRWRKKQGKVLIFPHVHTYRLYPEKAIRERLKKVDVINLEFYSKEERLRRTLRWNLLSKFGIDRIKLHGYPPKDAIYISSLKEIIKGIGKRVEFEKGIKSEQRLLLFFKFPVFRRMPEFEELMLRTRQDIEQLKKHVKKGKTVAILRGAAHEHPLTEMLRREGIPYEVIPLGGIAMHPKGTPLLISPVIDNYVKKLKKRPTNRSWNPPTEIITENIKSIFKRYPELIKYPTALYQIAIGLSRAKGVLTPKDVSIVEEFIIKDTITGKKIRVKDLI